MNKLEKRKKRARIVRRELKRLFPKAKMALKYSNNWQMYVAVVLSAQTTDKQVNKVTKDLFKKYKNLNGYLNVTLQTFQRDIKSIGFYKNKAKNILSAAKMLKEKFGGRFPKTMEEMLRIPGIGRKTANILLGNMHGISVGIAVDTHVRRLSRLFGLTNHSDPKKIEQDLMQILPKRGWRNFTYRMIEYGRKYSSARKKNKSDDVILNKLKKAGLR